LARALLAAHMVQKALQESRGPARWPLVLQRLAAEGLLFELTRRHLGWDTLLRGPHGFFPHIFLPDYHGPHFDEALQRLVFPKRGPNILYFSLTGACPCRCDYCFADAGGEDSPDLGDERVLRVAEEVAAQRIPLVNISGGEPLSRYRRLVDTVRVVSRGSEVRMFTTGIGLTDDRLAELADAGLRGVFVSLDGPNRDVFDRLRKKSGAFDAAVAALERCARADMLTFINCVVGASRFPRARDVADFLRFVEGIDSRIVVNFLPQLSTGRGASADSFADPEDCKVVAERITSTAGRMGRPFAMLFGDVDHFLGCPGAGGKLLNVDIEGNVTVCISRASLGNLLEESFTDIYGRFVESCHRLKVGFFCCEVSREHDEALLDPAATERALRSFYARTPDSELQRTLDRLDWLLSRLVPA